MSITVIGLGPAGLELLDQIQTATLFDESRVVIVRTMSHPAALQLSARRAIESCDDLYDSHADFDSLYAAIVNRVIAAAATDGVVYAVPGSASVGERTVSLLRTRAREEDIDVKVHSGVSFLDLVYVAAGVDPIADGLQVLDARALPVPLPLHLPTVITQVDSPLRASGRLCGPWPHAQPGSHSACSRSAW